MKKVLVAFGAVAVGVLLFPEDASAQRRGFGVGMGRSYGGGPALRGRVVAVQPGLGRAYYGTARYRPVLAHGYRGIGYPGRRWGYGGYRPYYGGRRFIGYGGAVAAGLIGGLALGSSVGFYGPHTTRLLLSIRPMPSHTMARSPMRLIRPGWYNLAPRVPVAEPMAIRMPAGIAGPTGTRLCCQRPSDDAQRPRGCSSLPDGAFFKLVGRWRAPCVQGGDAQTIRATRH